MHANACKCIQEQEKDKEEYGDLYMKHYMKETKNYYNNKYNFLNIVLDRINGIDLDTIVEATNIINPILDEYDLISDEYILDISSKERG